MASSHDATVGQFLIEVRFFCAAGRSMDGGTMILRPSSRGSRNEVGWFR